MIVPKINSVPAFRGTIIVKDKHGEIREIDTKKILSIDDSDIKRVHIETPDEYIQLNKKIPIEKVLTAYIAAKDSLLRVNLTPLSINETMDKTLFRHGSISRYDGR